MPHLREAGTDSSGAEISEAAVQFLRAHLETMTHEATAFYIDAPTIEILAEDHAPSLLINRLREILNRRDCADVELIGAAPATPEELAGVIERRTPSDDSGAAPEANTRTAEEVEEPGVTLDDEEEEEEEEDDAEDAVIVNGRQLRCVVCQGTAFEHRQAQLHAPTESSGNGHGRSNMADCHVCSACGYVHWFMH